MQKIRNEAAKRSVNYEEKIKRYPEKLILNERRREMENKDLTTKWTKKKGISFTSTVKTQQKQ